jgi:hypothetical protein
LDLTAGTGKARPGIGYKGKQTSSKNATQGKIYSVADEQQHEHISITCNNIAAGLALPDNVVARATETEYVADREELVERVGLTCNHTAATHSGPADHLQMSGAKADAATQACDEGACSCDTVSTRTCTKTS